MKCKERETKGYEFRDHRKGEQFIPEYNNEVSYSLGLLREAFDFSEQRFNASELYFFAEHFKLKFKDAFDILSHKSQKEQKLLFKRLLSN
jgi:hypothetical protein